MGSFDEATEITSVPDEQLPYPCDVRVTVGEDPSFCHLFSFPKGSPVRKRRKSWLCSELQKDAMGPTANRHHRSIS